MYRMYQVIFLSQEAVDCHHVKKGLFVGWLVGQQDYAKTTKPISSIHGGVLVPIQIAEWIQEFFFTFFKHCEIRLCFNIFINLPRNNAWIMMKNKVCSGG